jgi:glycosyltransferase involved in cell wall biosynthesis
MKKQLNNTVSIITPSCNQGQFIEQTIKSVLSQEGDFKIEYIVADGGSTDQTVEIIKKYDELLKKNQYPIKCKGIEFHWWSKKDKGQSDAINQGFKIATGKILAWINSDDFYEPGTFEYIKNISKKNPKIELFYGNMFVVNKKNDKTLKITRQGTYEDLVGFTGKDIYIMQPSTFFTNRVIKKVGLLDENLQYVMDYDLWIRILKDSPILYLNKTLANFRIWEKSKTTTQEKKFSEEKKKVRQKYGLTIIDKKLIKKLTEKKTFYFFRRKFPNLYNFTKKTFYNIANRIKY